MLICGLLITSACLLQISQIHTVEARHATIAMCIAQGFYRTVPSLKECLLIGPYQGTHGCLRIPFGKGVCGAAARTLETQVELRMRIWRGALHQLDLSCSWDSWGLACGL